MVTWMALPSMRVPLRLFGVRLGRHLHKTEPSRLTGSGIGDELDAGDLAETDEQIHKLVLGDRKRQIADIDIHYARKPTGLNRTSESRCPIRLSTRHSSANAPPKRARSQMEGGPEANWKMLAVAASYERLAERAEERARHAEGPNERGR
jgi:hypothetical protein